MGQLWVFSFNKRTWDGWENIQSIYIQNNMNTARTNTHWKHWLNVQDYMLLHCSSGALNSVLTLNMMNCFKDHKRYVHILNGILDLAWPKLMQLTLECMLSVLHSQYYACWCSGDFRSQSISRHGTDPQSRSIPSPTSEELAHWGRYKMVNIMQRTFSPTSHVHMFLKTDVPYFDSDFSQTGSKPLFKLILACCYRHITVSPSLHELKQDYYVILSHAAIHRFDFMD